MEFTKSSIEFQVQDLDEVKILIRCWNRVLARSQDREARSPRLTAEHLINISLEDREQPEELVLQFLGPPTLCQELVVELQAAGYDCPEIRAIQGLWSQRRLHVDQQ